MYDTAFRYMAASNSSLAWSKLNEQRHNDILKEETLPHCVNCHNYGHRTLACPARAKPTQSFCPLPAATVTHSPDTTPSLATAHQTHIHQPQSSVICHDYNHRICCRSDCQFQHICNKTDCGGAHPGFQCPKLS